MNKSESLYTLEESHASLSSLLSGSTHFSDNLLSDNSSPSPNLKQPVTVKARFRFASAFSLQSLRRSKKFSKKSNETSTPTASSIDIQNIEVASATKDGKNSSPKPEKRKFRDSLVKKLSLGSMKRNKKSAELKNSACDKKNITPRSLKRHTPEGANLSLSEVSLVDIDCDETVESETPKTIIPNIEPLSKSPPQKTTKPLILQREDQLQIITLTGKRDRKEIEFQVPITAEPHKPERKANRKINITESTDDALPRSPAPAVPYNISEVEISKILIATGGAVGHLTKHPTPACSSKGAIKKTITTTTQHKTRRDYFEAPSMSKSNSLERGRRYPRPVDELREMASDDSTPANVGNNLSNTNLSGSVTDIPVDAVVKHEEPNIIDASAVAACKPTIEFELGTKVRPPTHIRPSTLSSQTSLSSSSSSTQTRHTKLPQSMSVHFSRNDSVQSHESSLDLSSKSSESPEPRSEGSTARRRIAYMAIQSGSLSDDEENVVDSQPVSMVREPMSHLSGISEYSLKSDFSSVGYGDSMMDEAITMSSSTQEKREHLYKILVIGELGTGKTSFIKRYVHQFFSQNYRATIGVDFALKVLNWDQNTIIRLQLWDIAGQERFGNMTRVYYKEAVGAFIVFDVTRSATFDAVVKWKQDLDSKVQLPNGSPIPCILLANKCDQPKQGIVNTPQKMDEYVRENGFAGWFETSAKENVNIEEAARALVNKILLNDKLINSDDLVDADKFGLDSSQSSKKNCAC